MNFLDTVFPKAQAANKRLVLPEGHDPRVIIAAAKIKAQKIATPVVLATPEELAAAEAQAGVSLKDAGVEVLDYTKAPIASELIAAFYERRKAKGMTEEEADKTVRTKRLYFGNMMLNRGMVDGLVAGSIASTPDMLRSAFGLTEDYDGGDSYDAATNTRTINRIAKVYECSVVPYAAYPTTSIEARSAREDGLKRYKQRQQAKILFNQIMREG